MTSEREIAVTLPDVAALEAALLVVPGVSRASVAPDGVGGPGILRLVLEPFSDELVVARAVQRILRLQFGVGLDPSRIEIVEDSPGEVPPLYGPILITTSSSIDDVLDIGAEIDELLARLDPDPESGPRFHPDVLRSAVRHPAGAASDRSGDAALAAARATDGATSTELAAGEVDARPERLLISRLTIAADGLGVVVTVTLVRGSLDYSGTVDAPTSPMSVHRAVAAATLKALSGVLGPEHRVDVEAVAVTPLGEGQVAVVQVLWATADGNERLTGASEVRGDTRQAVIRATLDAVNRRLAPHLDL